MQHSLVSSFHFTGHFCFFQNEHASQWASPHSDTQAHTSFSQFLPQTHTHALTASLPQAWLHTHLLVTHTSTCSPTGNFNNLSITLPASHNTWIHKEHTASYTSCNTQHMDSRRTRLHTLPAPHNTRFTHYMQLHATQSDFRWISKCRWVQDGVKNTFVVTKGKTHSVQFAWTWTLSTLQYRHKHFWSAQNNNEKLPWGA